MWRSIVLFLTKTTNLNLLVSLYEEVSNDLNFIHYLLLSLFFSLSLSLSLSFSFCFSLSKSSPFDENLWTFSSLLDYRNWVCQQLCIVFEILTMSVNVMGLWWWSTYLVQGFGSATFYQMDQDPQYTMIHLKVKLKVLSGKSINNSSVKRILNFIRTRFFLWFSESELLAHSFHKQKGLPFENRLAFF